jgi:LCP family protein required for cell wall assembly
VHATRIRPESGPLDRRRLAAAGLSALLPGLGQLFNRRTRLAALFLIPSLILILVALVLLNTQSPARLLATVISPQVLGTLLVLNLILLAWRLLAVVQAFLDTSRQGPTGKLGVIGLVVIVVLVTIPHLAVWRYGSLLGDTFAEVFTNQTLGEDGPTVSPGPVPSDGQRINVLLIGIDKTAERTATLTDTMMVASLDPVGKTVSLLSVQRDLINTPLPGGDVYGPKLNSLMSYAYAHKDAFPQGGIRALQDAIGTLLDIPIHYYAEIDFTGLILMVNAVHGVDVDVTRAFNDPTYDGFGFKKHGYAITVGRHHLDGVNALAYARSRKALGESDFTRAARQQQILVALRDKVASAGSVLFALPDLLTALGKTVHSNVPVDRLPEFAAIVDEMGKGGVTSVVIRFPLVHPLSTRYGDSQQADIPAIRAMVAALFSKPGTPPVPWPTPKPTKAPKATPSP